MVKLALVVGHTKSSPGAFAVAPISAFEYAWNSDLAKMIIDHITTLDDAEAQVFCRDRGGIVGAYREVIDWGADAAMELHFNAAGPNATGSETLYCTAVSRPLALAVQDATVSVLGLRDRGVKTPQEATGGRGERNLRQMGSRPSILTEPFFGSNASDAKAADDYKPMLACAQAVAAVNVLANMDAENLWTVSATALNVRGGPGVGYDRLSWGPLNHGKEVEVIARDGDWAMIRTDEGEGYVYASFLV